MTSLVDITGMERDNITSLMDSVQKVDNSSFQTIKVWLR